MNPGLSTPGAQGLQREVGSYRLHPILLRGSKCCKITEKTPPNLILPRFEKLPLEGNTWAKSLRGEINLG